jgi:hypothetical protein
VGFSAKVDKVIAIVGMDDDELERIGLEFGVTFIVAVRLVLSFGFNFSDSIGKIDMHHPAK